MSNVDKETLTEYIKENPDLSYSELASCVIADQASSLSHRTLRLYAKLIKEQLASTPLDTTDLDALEPEPEVLQLEEDTIDAPILVKKTPKQAKILFVDIETSTVSAEVWGMGKQYISPKDIKEDRFIIGYVAKWLFDNKFIGRFVTPKEAKNRDDSKVVMEIKSLIDEAQYVGGHNVADFDYKTINTRSFFHGYGPLNPVRFLDTLKVAKKEFNFVSNSLEYICTKFLGEAKIDTGGKSLWEKCMAGDKDALAKMAMYCEQDVRLAEMLYVELRPYWRSHPNLAVVMDTDHPTCPNCGGFDFIPRGTYYLTQQNAYETVECTSCGAINRTKKSIIGTEQRRNMIVPIAR